MSEDCDATSTSLYNYLVSMDEYLKIEEASEIKYEFVGGLLFAMVGNTVAHSIIIDNLHRFLSNSIRASGCYFFSNMMKVKIEKLSSVYYPDVVVTCEKMGMRDLIVNEPALIIEVLSESTMSIDRREKRLAYSTLPSLREYVLISQYEVLVEMYRRDTEGVLQCTEYKKGASVPFTSIPGVPVELSMDQIYDGITFRDKD